jgi:acyl dehydratase
MVQQLDTRGMAPIGTKVTFSKTVGESDVYLFAGLTGDLSPNHVNDEYMAKTPYGKRIAHGVLVMGFMSTCSSKVIEQYATRPAVSLGYDRVRFTGPVYIGDTLTVTYEIVEQDLDKERTYSQVTAVNQSGETVAVATHILKYI